MTPSRYAANAMYEAIGALRAAQKEGDGLSMIIRKLEVSIEKIGGKEECTHSGMVATKSPKGGFEGYCSKCGETFYTDKP